MDVTGLVRQAWVDDLPQRGTREKKAKAVPKKKDEQCAEYIHLLVHEAREDRIILKWEQCPDAHKYEVQARRVDGLHVNERKFSSFTTGFYEGPQDSLMFDFTEGMENYGANFKFKIRAAFLATAGPRNLEWGSFSREMLAKKLASKDDRPLPCGSPDVLSSTHDTVRLEWPWPSKVQKVTKFELQYTQVSEYIKEVWRTLDADITGNRFTVENLKPMTSYLFRVRGHNFASWGPFGSVSKVVHTRAGCPSTPFVPFMTAQTVGSVTVEWRDHPATELNPDKKTMGAVSAQDDVLLLGYEIAMLVEEDVMNTTTYNIPLPEDLLSHTELDVPVFEWCRFKVRSFNSFGFSEWSAPSDPCFTKDATLNIPTTLFTAAKEGLGSVLIVVNRSPLHDELQLRGMRTITQCFQNLYRDRFGGEVEEGSETMPVRSLHLFQKWNFAGSVSDVLDTALAAMTSRPQHVQLQMWTCKCMSIVFRVCALSYPLSSEPSILQRLPWLLQSVKDCVVLILEAFSHHRKQKSVVQWGCACLQNMANLHSSIAQIFHAHPHVLPQLAEAAREFPETPNIVKHSFNAISIISQSTKRHETLYRLGVPALATAACFRYSSHQAVLSVRVS
jgi:hypothetical protein